MCHQGRSYNSGHYVTYAHVGNRWATYNDGTVKSEAVLPDACLSTSRLVLYERASSAADKSLSAAPQQVTAEPDCQAARDSVEVAAMVAATPNESAAPTDSHPIKDTRETSVASKPQLVGVGYSPGAGIEAEAASVPGADANELPATAEEPPATLLVPATTEACMSATSDNTTHVREASASAAAQQNAPTATSRQPRFMDEAFSQERLEGDVRELLGLFQTKQDCREFLHGLPLFAPAPDLPALALEFDQAVGMLCADQINSVAALQIRPPLIDTMVYPLLVLLQATAVSQGIPVVFFVDVLHAIVNAVFHKTYHVRMARWKSKSRHWWVGTANIGEGKSPGMKHFVNTMIEVLEANQAHAVGHPGDRFHFQQSGTTASALDKMRSCDAYLAVYCPDATRCLCPAAAAGGSTDPYRFIDLECFLDAARGDEASHSTQRLREKMGKDTIKHPSAPATKPQAAHMDPTNAHFIFLQQEVIFATWWCQLTPRKPVGIAQRFLLAFGGDADPAPMAYSDFMDDVTLPVLRDLFTLVVRHVGPKLTGAKEPIVRCSDDQNQLVEELEGIVKLHSRRHTVPETFRGALPKAMYWLGTALLLNHTIVSLWPAALTRTEVEGLPGHISDATFAASTRFVHRRYLAGQAVLAVSVKEKVWAGRELAHKVVPGDLVPMLLRILRGSPGNRITLEGSKSIVIELKRYLREFGTSVFAAAELRLERLWRMLADVGIGQMGKGAAGNVFLQKYARSSRSGNTLAWLEENRVPGYMSGIGATFARRTTPEKSTSLRGTNPSVTVRATAADPLACVGDTTGSAAKPLEAAAAVCEIQREKQPQPMATIHSEIVDGLLLDRARARDRMREVLIAHNIVAEVNDIKPLTHERYWLFKGVCLRCRGRAASVSYRGTYYRQAVGVPAKTFVLTAAGSHNHAEDAPADIARVFTPQQEKVARPYIAGNLSWTTKGLTNVLVAAGFAETSLPSSHRRSRWLQNHKPKPSTAQRIAKGPPREELLTRSLEEWPTEEPDTPAELFLVNYPPRMLSGPRVCIPFASRGMVDCMRRLADSELVLFVDAKQSCMAHGWGVLTSSFLVRDRLRYTTLGRVEGKRVQGMAFTSHACPVLQAIIHVENTENLAQFFCTLKALWSRTCPGRPDLEHCVRQVHKDYLPAIEAARVLHFPRSRPVNEFSHLMGKRKTIEQKLQNTELRGRRIHKAEFGWVIAALNGLRHIPTADLFSALWAGWLRRLRHKGEALLEEYLGPSGTGRYTQRLTVRELRMQFNVPSMGAEDDVLHFAPHWAGLMGILPGSDCGGQPQEASHSPWNSQLETLGSEASSTQVLTTMQELYRTWAQQCDWCAETPLQMSPPTVDPEHTAGTLLARVGRSSAVAFAEQHEPHHIVDISEFVQVVALPQNTTRSLDRAVAQSGAQMMFLGGQALVNSLREHGLLQIMESSDSAESAADCTFLSAVLRYYVNISYVIVRAPGHGPHEQICEPLCTCAVYCGYGGCEHVEFVKTLNLRLRPATASLDALPVLKRRGRKPGHTLTQRGAERAEKRLAPSA